MSLNPAQKISSQLVRHLFDAIDEHGLTIYGAAMLIATDGDEEIKTVHQRLKRYQKHPPKRLDLLIGMLAVFDCQVQVRIVRKKLVG